MGKRTDLAFRFERIKDAKMKKEGLFLSGGSKSSLPVQVRYFSLVSWIIGYISVTSLPLAIGPKQKKLTLR